MVIRDALLDPIRDRPERDEKLAAMIAQLMALMSGEDGLSTPLQEGIAQATRDLIGVDLTRETIFAAVASNRNREDVLANAAQWAAAFLAERGKEHVLRAAILASPSWPLAYRERALANDITREFGLTTAHLDDVLGGISWMNDKI
jgi:hypothetical protein